MDTTLSACPLALASCGASSTVPCGSSISGGYPAAAGGNPVRPGTTTRSGEKSTVAGKVSTPPADVTFCTAAVPLALASLLDRFTPYVAAALLVEASRITYHTGWSWLIPRCNGNVTVPSPCSTALRTNRVRPPSAAFAGLAVTKAAAAAITPSAATHLFIGLFLPSELAADC